MRILIVNDYKDNSGGAEVYNHRLKEMLESKDHDVKFYGAEENKDTWKTYISSWYSINAKKEFGDILDEFNPDLVHCHNLFDRVSPSILSEAKKREIPITKKFGDMRLSYKYQIKDIFRRNSWEKIHPLLYLTKLPLHRHLIQKYSDCYIFQSDYINEHLIIGQSSRKQISNPTPWQSEEETEDENYILFVGSLSTRKGIDVLRDAAEMLEDLDLNIEIVGDKLDKNDELKYRGYIKDEDQLKSKYKNASALVLPSIIPESFGLVIVEAYSQGTPVITTNIGGQKELVKDGETGFLVEPTDPEELAEKIKEITENPKMREKMSENALEYAEEFSKEKHVEEMEKLFDEVIDENSSD